MPFIVLEGDLEATIDGAAQVAGPGGPGSQVVQTGRLRREVGDDIAQRVSARLMRRRQRHELRKARQPARRPTLMMARGKRVEFMSCNQPQELAEHCAMMSQRLGSSSGVNGLSQFHCTTRRAN